MKYMSFQNSCSFAGVANLLEQYGVDAEADQIALGMHLPYMMEKTKDGYQAGPMLQTRKWFDLYLNPLGFEMQETLLNREQVISFLKENEPCMIGVKVNPAASRHAIIYVGAQNGTLVFLNNRRKDSAEPDSFRWTEAEFLNLMDREIIPIAKVVPCEKKEVFLGVRYEETLDALANMKERVNHICKHAMDVRFQQESKETVFRAILLDNIAVLKLTQEKDLTHLFEIIQGQYLSALAQKKELVLEEYMDMNLLNQALDRWKDCILNEQHKAIEL
ncbi:MAG: hypothetical protein MR016_00820 [Agathobacter sp.]|nr:hypothetical protein [Agathobacter sp.]